jgi:hypothetical protein
VTQPDAPGGNRRRGVPTATYRLQIHAGFPLQDAADVAGYLADLGVSHAYSSPLLRSAEGSNHVAAGPGSTGSSSRCTSTASVWCSTSCPTTWGWPTPRPRRGGGTC